MQIKCVGINPAYHRTHLELEPKIGVRHVDLLNLYKRVVEEGGYDLCSDTKAKPLMWRRLAEEFIGKNQYTAAQAFQIKNVYYKNLCAYEISTHWGKEPPPKEILEDVTAKGGNVMSRTLENFQRPAPREAEGLQNGDASDGSPDQKTPGKEDRLDTDDPGSATGRSSRGLRQQPPQRVLFQPDLRAARQTRVQDPAGYASPTPGIGANGLTNPSTITNGASATLASYEPSQSYPLSLKPVVTPANNPEYYRMERKRKAEANAGPLTRKYRHIMLPGTGFVGPNIYVRAQMALQSGIPDEERYALHHLVKISHERGDKYRFDQFPGLADALIQKVLCVSSLFYDVEFDVLYDDIVEPADDEALNGLHATADIVQRLHDRMPLITNDSILDAQFIDQLGRIAEAALVLRNMAQSDNNAQYLVQQATMRDYLAIVLNLPPHPSIVELQYYALDTAEVLVTWYDLDSQDPLYQSLLAQLQGGDRGLIVSSLKTIARIAMNLMAPKRLDNVPVDVLRKVQTWLLVEDEELRSACLDFLFQYTSFANNVHNLLQITDSEALARQLSSLLLFAAKEHVEHRPETSREEDITIPPVPRVNRSIVEKLIKLEEPERSSEWLRMCFISDPGSEMTQISLWQAYQSTFAPFSATHPHLIAGDFIKNVSSTFPGATAQVANANKYVIKGIRSRKTPIDTGTLAGSRSVDKGKDLHRCNWTVTVNIDPIKDPLTGVQSGPTTREVSCAEWFRHSDDMLVHILETHLRIPLKKSAHPGIDVDQMDIDTQLPRPPSAMANGYTNGVAKTANLGELFDFAGAENIAYRCRWANCRRHSAEFEDGKTPRIALLARHIQTHLPDADPTRAKHNLRPGTKPTSRGNERSHLLTLADERGDAAGLPLGAALVLRNIAKFMPHDTSMWKRQGDERKSNGKLATDKEDEDLIKKIFNDEVCERMFFAMTRARPIHDYIGGVLRALARNEQTKTTVTATNGAA
nr:chromatin structure-remodeling complex subunit rsc9 [Quercus suber]